MTDINKPLRIIYNTLLSTIGVDVFSNMAPDGQVGSYIIYRPVSGSMIPDFNKQTVRSQFEIKIYTEGEKYNSGDSLDNIAANVYTNIYPKWKVTLLGGHLVIDTELVSDNTDNWTTKDVSVCMDRTIVFEHIIYLNI